MEWNKNFKLRPYQREFCQKVTHGFQQGPDGQPLRRALGVAGTGAGKTIMASALIFADHYHNPAAHSIFLADRDELVSQAADKIFQTTGIIADIEQGSSRASLESPIVVASIQTIARPERLSRFPPGHFDFAIADEAHLSLAGNWQRALAHLDPARLLGITATPARLDKKLLLDYYEAEVANIGLFDLINLRALVPITVQTIGIEIDATGIKNFADGGESDEAAEAVEPYWDKIIDAWEEHAHDRPTLIFHPSRKASRAFTERLRKRGHRAAHVDGNSPDRQEILQAFHDGKIDILNNAQLLTTGYDEPRIACVINLRPTKSKTAYQQTVGRGTRLYCPVHRCNLYCDHETAKHDLLLLDFLWQFATLGVMRPADLIADSEEQKQAIQQRLEAGEKQLNLADIDEQVTGEREQAMIRALKRANKKGPATYDARSVAAVCHIPAMLDYEPLAHWERQPPSEKQLAWLTKQGVDPETITSRGQAKAIMDSLMDRYKAGTATLRQTVTLAKMGVDQAFTLTIQEAGEIIDQKFRKRLAPHGG